MGEWHSQHLLGCQCSVLRKYNMLNLELCGGGEHRALKKITQLEIQTVQDPDDPSLMTVCLVYTEHGSKIGLEAVSSWISPTRL